MKHLVILTDNFLPRMDGIVRFLIEIIPRLQDNYKITVVCPNYKTAKVIDGVDYVTIPLSKHKVGDFSMSKWRPLKLFKIIRKADVVFSQTIGPIGGLGLFIAQRLGKKTVSYIHSVEWELFPKAVSRMIYKKYAGSFSKWLVRLLYSRSSHLIVPSERVADMMVWQDIKTPKTVIHLGVDTKRFAPLANRDEVRASLAIQKEDIVVGYHGRLAKEKDVLTILRAFIKLRKKHTNLKLLIVGSGPRHIVKRFQKQQGVIYLPSQEKVELYVGAMDIYCLASLTETTSLATLEAMSTALPVISTPVGYIRDYIKHGVNGFFFKTGSSHDLAKKIEVLMRSNSVRHKVGLCARDYVRNHFSWDTTAKKLILFFENFTK